MKNEIYILFDGMAWPRPGEALGDRAWRFTNDWEGLTRTDHLVAASVMAAYNALVDMPVHRRNKVISNMKSTK